MNKYERSNILSFENTFILKADGTLQPLERPKNIWKHILHMIELNELKTSKADSYELNSNAKEDSPHQKPTNGKRT